MIAETSQNILVGLLVVTFLGAVMGYVIATIRARKHTEGLEQNLRSELRRVKVDTKAELALVADERDEYQAFLGIANERVASALKKEEALETHAQFLSQRIQSLESQVSSSEEQQIRLQRDFATYKSNKARELELARANPRSLSQAGHLPVLNKRISREESEAIRPFSGLGERESETLGARLKSKARAARSHTKLSLPLSQELDIPTLAESELPDSVEELEFELVDFDTDGGNSRG